MTTAIREWCRVEFSPHYTDQSTLQRMARDILANAEEIKNEETPGHSEQNISRVITATSSLLPDTTYIIHVDGFTVSNIAEIIRR